MCTPKQFEQDGVTIEHAVIRANSFALFCIADESGAVQAVHVPTMLENDYGDFGRLQFQVAKKNPIWNLFDGTRQALAIFSGPHAYISPDWYETKGFVPTWDYVAVADLVVGGQ